jgi:hypothetical protein
MSARMSYKNEFPIKHGCSRRRTEVGRRFIRVNKKKLRQATKKDLDGAQHV